LTLIFGNLYLNEVAPVSVVHNKIFATIDMVTSMRFGNYWRRHYQNGSYHYKSGRRWH